MTDSKPLLFISHRHADSRIADVLSDFITSKSMGSVEVFQSSSASKNSLQFGQNLNQQLVEKLKTTKALILVYTEPEHDWSYCMWECGLALDPSPPPTNVILFQCAGYSPAPFSDQLKVDIHNQAHIQQFTNAFLTSDQFFPRFGRSVTFFQSNGTDVINCANELYSKLQEVAPTGEKAEEWDAWPFLQLELSLEHVNRIRETDPSQRPQIASDIIQQECFLTQGSDVTAVLLFNMGKLPIGKKFQVLINTWRNYRPQSQSKWVEALCAQIMKAAEWQHPELQWELMKDTDNDKWYAPVLSRVRYLPSRQCFQFDIYFYKFDINPAENTLNVGIPGNTVYLGSK